MAPFTYAVSSPDRPQGRFLLRIPDPVPGRRADLVLHFHATDWCQIDFAVPDFYSTSFPRRGDWTEPIRQVVDFIQELLDERQMPYVAFRDGTPRYQNVLPAMAPDALRAWWLTRPDGLRDADTIRTFSWRGTFDAVVALNHPDER